MAGSVDGMDDQSRTTAGRRAQAGTVPVPTAGRVVAGTLPASAVLVIAMPLALWWLLDAPSVEPRTPWWPVPLIGLPVLFHVLARYARTPRPRPPQVSAEQVRTAVVTASRTGAVPSEPQVRTAAGVTSCQRIEAAAHALAALVGVLIASLVVPQPPWTVFIVFGIALAVHHAVRARRSWAYLRELHPAGRAG